MCNGESKSGPKDDPCAPMGDTEPKIGPKDDPFVQMCNPQDESQMAQEMGWSMDVDSRLASEAESQMAEDWSWPVVEDDTPQLLDQPHLQDESQMAQEMG
eukprot:7839205-Karenia_brevis.AAC.1